jgi:hypothetical protein
LLLLRAGGSSGCDHDCSRALRFLWDRRTPKEPAPALMSECRRMWRAMPSMVMSLAQAIASDPGCHP